MIRFKAWKTKMEFNHTRDLLLTPRGNEQNVQIFIPKNIIK